MHYNIRTVLYGPEQIGCAECVVDIKGNPCLCAISATASMSIMLLFGFPSVSINMAFVFGHIAFSKFSIDDGSTNVADIPYAGKVLSNRL